MGRRIFTYSREALVFLIPAALAWSPIGSYTSCMAPVGARGGQAAAGRDGGGPVSGGLQVYIEAQRAPFQEGQPIYVVFHVLNVTPENFDFAWRRSGWESNFGVDVTTDLGDPVRRGEVSLKTGSNTTGRIGPAHEYVEIGDIRDEYALGPGKYYLTATASFTLWDLSRSVQALSNTIGITVIPARKDVTAKELRLGMGQAQWVFEPGGAVTQGPRLTNPGDHDIEVDDSERGRAWFEGVTLDFRTLAGDTVPRKRDADGHELLLEKDGWGPYSHRAIISGPIRPGDSLDGQLLLYRLYQLSPGMAYTLTAHLTLRTLNGLIELTSNTITFAIKAN